MKNNSTTTLPKAFGRFWVLLILSGLLFFYSCKMFVTKSTRKNLPQPISANNFCFTQNDLNAINTCWYDSDKIPLKNKKGNKKDFYYLIMPILQMKADSQPKTTCNGLFAYYRYNNNSQETHLRHCIPVIFFNGEILIGGCNEDFVLLDLFAASYRNELSDSVVADIRKIINYGLWYDDTDGVFKR